MSTCITPMCSREPRSGTTIEEAIWLTTMLSAMETFSWVGSKSIAISRSIAWPRIDWETRISCAGTAEPSRSAPNIGLKDPSRDGTQIEKWVAVGRDSKMVWLIRSSTGSSSSRRLRSLARSSSSPSLRLSERRLSGSVTASESLVAAMGDRVKVAEDPSSSSGSEISRSGFSSMRITV